jgi:hypothetical protein
MFISRNLCFWVTKSLDWCGWITLSRMLHWICQYGGYWVTWWVVVSCKTNFSKKRGHCSHRCCSIPSDKKKKLNLLHFHCSINARFFNIDEKHSCWAVVRMTVYGDTQTEKLQVWGGMKVHVEQWSCVCVCVRACMHVRKREILLCCACRYVCVVSNFLQLISPWVLNKIAVDTLVGFFI